MSNEERSGFGQLLDMLGKIIAVVMILRYAALIVENYVSFLPTEGFLFDLINYVGMYAPMALMIVVGLEAVWDKSDLLKIVFLLICAALVIFSFFPDVWATIISYTGIQQASN